MTKIILSIIFITSSILVFTFYTKGAYDKIRQNRLVVANYKRASDKAQLVLDKIDELITKRNEFSDADMASLLKMVPDSVDNIQLILDIEGVTKRYDMKLRKVNISKSLEKDRKKNNKPQINIGAGPEDTVKSLEVSFDVVATYDDFIKFMLDLEHSLRLVDFVSINISSKDKNENISDTFESGLTTNNPSVSTTTPQDAFAPKYTFSVVLKTYWLNNK